LILLDSNTVIHYLKGRATVVSQFQAASPRELALPSIVTYEIEYGTLKLDSAARRATVSSLLANLTHVPFDREAALESGQIRLLLERRGHIIGPHDLLIAGTALSRGAVLVTSNTREFSRVPGLHLADWTK
jgi:tRNA(fMet)-specific endonuclease VapC